ncbi:hypothetical protein E2C01_095893 [Portunus trituberculatus]|uniref:Uncharacterized protein n=1 Tax=Portunus trituberculatus TaxID=210409 RepID=A0A5B7JR17_PORTR|nr:hypothetical protein [Portunus trituberculatus]
MHKLRHCERSDPPPRPRLDVRRGVAPWGPTTPSDGLMMVKEEARRRDTGEVMCLLLFYHYCLFL